MDKRELTSDISSSGSMASIARNLVRVTGHLDALRIALGTRDMAKGCGQGDSSETDTKPPDATQTKLATVIAGTSPVIPQDSDQEGCACAANVPLSRAKQLSRKLARLSRQVGRQLDKRDSKSGDEQSTQQLHSLKAAPALQARIVEAFALQGLDHEEVSELVQDALNEQPPAPWRATLKSIVAATDAIAALGLQEEANLRKTDLIPAKVGIGGADTGTTSQGLELTSAVVVLLKAAIGGVVRLVVHEFLDLLADLFNKPDDDNARRFIQTTSCADLRAMTPEGLYRLVLPMLEGPTGNDDERAILRLLNCLRCDQVSRLFYLLDRTGWSLLDEFHGQEFERLLIRLQACGLMSFGEWDDDTTRRFIMSHMFNCGPLGKLPLEHVRMLLRNLFSGYTGDEDEFAILLLLRCQSCARMKQLVQLLNMSVDDFDDEVDGAEWTRLAAMFRACGIRVG